MKSCQSIYFVVATHTRGWNDFWRFIWTGGWLLHEHLPSLLCQRLLCYCVQSTFWLFDIIKHWQTMENIEITFLQRWWQGWQTLLFLFFWLLSFSPSPNHLLLLPTKTYILYTANPKVECWLYFSITLHRPEYRAVLVFVFPNDRLLAIEIAFRMASLTFIEMAENGKKIDWPYIVDKNRRFRLLNMRLESVWTHLFSIRWRTFFSSFLVPWTDQI